METFQLLQCIIIEKHFKQINTLMRHASRGYSSAGVFLSAAKEFKEITCLSLFLDTEWLTLGEGEALM